VVKCEVLMRGATTLLPGHELERSEDFAQSHSRDGIYAWLV
jgi:hypothetical protein